MPRGVAYHKPNKSTNPVDNLKARVWALKEAKMMPEVKTVTREVTVKIGDAEVTHEATFTYNKPLIRVSKVVVRRRR